MIFESKIVTEKESRKLHVSRRGANTLEKWVFVEQDEENYTIAFYEKLQEEDDSTHISLCVYTHDQAHTAQTKIELHDVPLPDDLIAEIAKLRRKLTN